MKALFPWIQIDDCRWERQEDNDDKRVVAFITRRKMAYTATYINFQNGIEVRDFFISLKSSKTWIDDKLLEQGFKEQVV